MHLVLTTYNFTSASIFFVASALICVKSASQVIKTGSITRRGWYMRARMNCHRLVPLHDKRGAIEEVNPLVGIKNFGEEIRSVKSS